jgi:para-aminobenzoate synthetase component I
MNKYGAEREPFMYIVDYKMECPEIYKLNEVPKNIRFATPLISSDNQIKEAKGPFSFIKHPVSFNKYEKAFRNVQKNIISGNSYLLNLTFPTRIETKMTLEDIYNSSCAKYKLLYHNKFVVFSPEIFVRIKDGVIKSYPMKGTIDSSVFEAEKVILNDAKEEAEHNTIIDLIRNDISKVAYNVKVTKYRYIETIMHAEGELLQVSSEISGLMRDNYLNHLGEIIAALLPAGSVTGAPKKETLRIIKESETYKRGWYTGVFGIFDGESLDSGVMIRFIEKMGDKLYFKSGGGLTFLSDALKEYEELISKVYVPLS